MTQIRSLFELRLTAPKILDPCDNPQGRRRNAALAGGERQRRIAVGSSCGGWQPKHRGNVTVPDVRAPSSTDDGEHVHLSHCAARHERSPT